jgi:CRP-like cAMP-binding protein
MYNNLKQVFNSISLITDEDWLMLEPQLRVKNYKKNDYYLTTGDVEKQIGFITTGSFKWYYINQKGEEVNYHFFLENNFVVDFLSFVTQSPSQMFIQAMEDIHIIR